MLEENRSMSQNYQNLEVCTEKLEKCFERNSASNLIDNKVSYPSYSEIQEPFIRRDFPIRKDLPTDWDYVRILGRGSFMEQAINLIVLPLTLCDSKSNLYRVELLFYNQICLCRCCIFIIKWRQ
jgi:hypothetical protein